MLGDQLRSRPATSLGRRATSTVLRAGARTPSGARYLAVDFVHGREVVHVLEKDGGLDDLGEAGAGGLEDGLQVFEHAGGLFR